MANNKLDKPSALEKVAGNTGTEIAATLLAAFSGNPVASLLPVLTNALASGRHKQRVEKAINEIGAVLEEHSDLLRNITDQQYKLINETVLSIFNTVDSDKLEYLKRVIRNTLDNNNIKSQEAELMSRVIRDMSAEEFRFLIENYSYNRIQLSKMEVADDKKEVLRVDPESREGLIVSGLISLGLLLPAEPTWDDSGLHRFSNVVAKLIALLREENT